MCFFSMHACMGIAILVEPDGDGVKYELIYEHSFSSDHSLDFITVLKYIRVQLIMGLGFRIMLGELKFQVCMRSIRGIACIRLTCYFQLRY